MDKIVVKEEFFSVEDTLKCGQVFRFFPYQKGYKIISQDKCAYAYNENGYAVIECLKEDRDYFCAYFDLGNDYLKIYSNAKTYGGILSVAAEAGKGIRILKQDKTETLFSFMISQNNNIPRIKGTIEKLCTALGEKKEFCGEIFYGFPSVSVMAEQSAEFYKSIGLGYRAEYILSLAKKINAGYNVNALSDLETMMLKRELLSIYGVGEKVCDCVLFFGFGKTDSFPVDTWLEKVYREDFSGEIKDRKKISAYFTNLFKENSGYFQQYLFHYKRNVENKTDKKGEK